MKIFLHLITIFLIITSCVSENEADKDVFNLNSKYSGILSKGEGQIVDLSEIRDYHTFQLKQVSKDSVQLFHNDTLTNFDDFKIKYNEDLKITTSFLFIDKDIKFSFIEELFNMLSGFHLNRICIVMNNPNRNTKLNGIRIYLPYSKFPRFDTPYYVLPPPPPPLPNIVEIEKKSNVYKLKNDSLFLNDILFTNEEFKNVFASTIRKNPKKLWAYYIDRNASFQSLVQFYDICYTEYYKERDVKAMELYNTDFSTLNDSLKKIIRKKVPIRIRRVTKTQYDHMTEMPHFYYLK